MTGQEKDCGPTQSEKPSAYLARSEVTSAIIDALEISGYEPIPLGHACLEVCIGGRIIRVDVVSPTKPWTECDR